MVTISELESALQNSWNRETCDNSQEWSPDNPAEGQCAVTALIVNDHFGGQIIHCYAIIPRRGKRMHYFNKKNGKDIDITKSQFSSGTVIPKGEPKRKGFASTRDFILSHTPTGGRYDILKKRVMEYLR